MKAEKRKPESRVSRKGRTTPYQALYDAFLERLIAARERYTAGRGAHETVQVLNEVGTPVPISLDRDQIFSALSTVEKLQASSDANPVSRWSLLRNVTAHKVPASSS